MGFPRRVVQRADIVKTDVISLSLSLSTVSRETLESAEGASDRAGEMSVARAPVRVFGFVRVRVPVFVCAIECSSVSTRR